MGDNSYGQRVPWPGQGTPVYNYPQSGGRPQLDPRLAMQMQPPMMNGFPGMPQQMPQQIPQHLAMSGAGPLWDMDVSSQMFMQAINFDKLMAERQAGLSQMANTSVNEDLNGKMYSISYTGS